jgi:hypothetical protein
MYVVYLHLFFGVIDVASAEEPFVAQQVSRHFVPFQKLLDTYVRFIRPSV